MNELALFAGAGGGLLATKWFLRWRTICYVEKNPYRVEVLKARIRDGLLDDAPIWDDARTFDGRPWAGCVDIVTAGFPCQPFSTAGKRLGEDDDRNMWPQTIRIIRECKPFFAFLENVPGLVSSGYIFTILNDLSQAGYKAFPPIRLAASDVGANHRRRRIWIVAYSDSGCGQRAQKEICSGRYIAELCGEDVADTHSGGFREYSQLDGQAEQDTANRDSRGRYTHGRGDEMANSDSERCTRASALPKQAGGQRIAGGGWWETEPQLGRVADGVANRVERVAAIGDGQVPAVVAAVWKLLTEAK